MTTRTPARARIRFTIGQFARLVAVLAAPMTLMRTVPPGPVVLIFIMVTSGFAIDRSRGGRGVEEVGPIVWCGLEDD